MSRNDPKESGLPQLFPYPLVMVENVNDKGTVDEGSIVYEFTTDKGVLYQLVFLPDYEYLPSNNPVSYLAYSFILNRISDKVGAIDPRIKDTVVYGLDAAFSANPHLIVSYQCSAKDAQQRFRAILFRKWLDLYGSNYETLDFTDGFDLYATAFFRKDHSMRMQIRQTFEEVYRNK